MTTATEQHQNYQKRVSQVVQDYGFQCEEHAAAAIKAFWNSGEYLNAVLEDMSLIPDGGCTMGEFFEGAAMLPATDWEEVLLLS